LVYLLTFAAENETNEGNDCRSLLLYSMANENIINTVSGFLTTLLADSPEVFLVDMRIKPTNNIKIFLDADAGISIEKCVSYNRRLYRLIEEAGLFTEGDFSLEVSSPGLDEPLKLQRQYKKNIGRNVEVMMVDGQKIDGKLLSATDDGIQVEETKGKNKKKEVVEHNLLFSNIKSTKVQVVF